MVDAIISTVVEDLNSMMFSSIKEEMKLVSGVSDEVKKLVDNFKSIRALLDDAEERQLKEASVKNWLFDLKAVSYDMDDVIDEWKTWIQTSQLQNQHHSSDPIRLLNKVLSIVCCLTRRDVKLRHVVGRKIREIQQRLDDIATDKVTYLLTSSQKTDKHIERHETTSFIDIQQVKGRDKEKDEVKRNILEAKSNPHIISLVGSGGIGQTTLAKLIYNDSEIQNHFEKKIWVCASKPFHQMCIAKPIRFESLCDSSTVYDFKELKEVLKEISEVLNKKRFLLVLDDVWIENRRQWEELKKSVECGLPGSTILITTRDERVATVMGCNLESIHKVGLLTSDECWSIISQIAFVQGDHQKLESIGRRIADKCKGLPLAATTIGGLLRFKKPEKEWLRVLEKKDVLDPLKLSYYDLPSLKQCFSYCAIFPKNSKIEKRRLIGMWMAQGYLKGKEECEDLEMIGETYYHNLIALSLLQISSDDDDYCILHEMESDLAQTFAKNEYLMIEALNDAKLNINSLHANANVRHLSLMIENDAPFPKYIYGFAKLRTLIIQFVGYRSLLNVDAVKDIFDYLTCLRTLDLSKCGIEEVPPSINKLVHLRWLNLSENRKLEKLPETLCDCYNLQTLILNWCQNLVALPQRIGKLDNLMYLDIEDSCKIKYLPKGIGNLWRLRELTVFIVSVNEDKSFSIVEMGKLNNLRGSLKIRGLGNVRKLKEARKAKLTKKKKVTDLSLSFDRDLVQEDEKKTKVTNLSLSFDRDRVQEDEEELLEALEPPSDLEILAIKEYEGKKLYPSWMMELNLLRVLKLQNCSHCEELPPLGKLPCLEKLYLQNMGVKRVGVEFMGIEKEKDPSTFFESFPKLKVLQFWISWEWEEWDDVDEQLMERITAVMPCLQELTIFSCPKLKRLPSHLLSSTITRLQLLNIKYSDALQQEIQKYELSKIPRREIMSEVTGSRARMVLTSA